MENAISNDEYNGRWLSFLIPWGYTTGDEDVRAYAENVFTELFGLFCQHFKCKGAQQNMNGGQMYPHDQHAPPSIRQETAVSLQRNLLEQLGGCNFK